ncbi:MAG: aconitate hydratase [Deltaproteobacteria bacterium]|nr:aconitate hydratase [Deltaproteobacteria bacterium]
MGESIVQKILSQHVADGSVVPGQEIGLVIDQCLTQDSTGTMAWLEFEVLDLERVQAPLVVSYNDHTSLAFKGESSDDHMFLQTSASHFGALYSKAGNGVCHQLQYERFAVPGKTLLGSDSHTPTCGSLAMMAIGAGGMDVAVAMGGGFFYMTVPKVIKVELTGRLPWGSSAKDVILHLLREISVKGGVGFILEYDGPGVETLSIPERATITNMGAETGATTSIFPSDEVTHDFMTAQGRGDQWKPLCADPDAVYDKVIHIDLSQMRPLVAMTGMPDNVKDMIEVAGTHLDQVYIGSCTNGSYRDLQIAAKLLKGRHVAPTLDCIVSPGSRQAEQMLLQDGSIETFIEAGVRVIEPGCNACIGIGFVPGNGHLSLRTVNRNWVGRGGTNKGYLALSSVETAVASAIAGCIADPSKLPQVSYEERPYVIDTLLFLEPEGPKVAIRRSPNIVAIKPQKPMGDRLTGRVLLKVADGISTDDILPAGPLTQHLRSNLPAIAQFVFHYQDPTFAKRAAEAGGGFIVGGENYGQGSSREHAALGPWQLGIKAVLARSFARIHCSNLVNAGILPLQCDTGDIDQEDELIIELSNLSPGKPMRVENRTKGRQMDATPILTKRQAEIVQSGGLLAYTRQRHG